MQVYDGFADAKMKAERAEKETGKTMNNRKCSPGKSGEAERQFSPAIPKKNISYLANFSQFL